MVASRICITGSNGGVGYEAARQFALKSWVKSIILACRNLAKAEEAKASLEKETGRLGCFEILIIDLSDLKSIEKAVESLSSEHPIDGLILNAGGFAGNQPTAQTKNGTMKIFDLNVLGSVYFTELLIEQNKLKLTTTTDGDSGSSWSSHVLYVSSECSRGIRGIDANCTLHEFTDGGSVEEMKAICNGSYFQANKKAPKKDLDIYGRVKMIGNLWVGYMARKYYPNTIRFVAVSPGNTVGTNVVNHMNKPTIIKYLANTLYLPLMVKCGKFHTLETGAYRYLNVMICNDQEDDDTESVQYQSGHFYATGTRWNASTGKNIFDQQRYAPNILYNKQLEDNANEAIHSFLPTKQLRITNSNN